jgi:hypothetical protein
LVVEEEINNQLILALFGWDDILFRQNDASRRDTLDLMKLYAEAERMGVMSIDQVAGEFGYPPIKGGDVHFIQTAAGAIPVEWLDDVAKRLINPTGQPLTGAGTTSQPSAGQVQAPSGSPAGQGVNDQSSGANE